MATLNNTINNTSYGITVIGTANINSGAVDNATNIGSATGVSALTVVAGTGGMSFNSTSTGAIVLNSSDLMTLDAVGVLNLNSSGADISIGNNADAFDINMGTGASQRVITIGNVTASTAVNVNSGDAGITLTTASGGDFTINSGDAVFVNSSNQLNLDSNGGDISIGTNADNFNVLVGTAGTRHVTLGSTSSTSQTTLQAGSVGINITGFAEGALTTDSSGVISTVTGTLGYVLTSNGAGVAPSFQLPSMSAWTNVMASTVALVANNSYVMNDGATLITATLPVTAAFGTFIEIQGMGTGLWTIAQNAGQIIHYGIHDTATGVTGSLSSTAQYDNVQLLCIVADTEWVVMSGNIGNLSIA